MNGPSNNLLPLPTSGSFGAKEHNFSQFSVFSHLILSFAAAIFCCKSWSLREIGGKTHTFWFDWGPAGEPVVVGVRSLAQKPLPYKVNGVFEVIVFCLRKSVLLDVDVFCIRWLLFCFASIFRKKKKKEKRVKYRPLWQLNFFQVITNL